MASITCGHCKNSHASAQDVRECYFDGFSSQDEMDAYYEAEARAEQAAEAAAERYYENLGWAETAAFEDWERAQGKISYEEARDMAMGL